MTWIEVRRDLDCGEVWVSGPGWTWQGWRWDANICNLDGAWMEVTQEYWDLNAGDAGSGWRWDTNLGTWLHQDGTLKGLKLNLQDLDGVEMWPGLSWDAHLETWIGWYGTRSWDTIRQLRKDLDGGETHILKPVWVWDDAWVELRCNLVGQDVDEMLPGCRRDANIRTQIEVRFNRNREETWIWEPGWRGDTNL